MSQSAEIISMSVLMLILFALGAWGGHNSRIVTAEEIIEVENICSKHGGLKEFKTDTVICKDEIKIIRIAK